MQTNLPPSAVHHLAPGGGVRDVSKSQAVTKQPAAGPLQLRDVDAYEGPRSKPPAPARPILLYNDQCETCQVLSAWVKERDLSGGDIIDERPIGNDPAALKALDPRLEIWDVYKQIHVLMPNGDIKKGGAAIGEVLRRLPGFGWTGPLMDVSIGGFKPFERFLHLGYTVLDSLRPALGCSSCGGGPVKWWAKPIKWAADAVHAVRRLFGAKDAGKPALPAQSVDLSGLPPAAGDVDLSGLPPAAGDVDLSGLPPPAGSIDLSDLPPPAR